MFVSKVTRFLVERACSPPPALWQGEREHLGQKLLLTEVLLFTYPMIEKCLQWGSPELSHGKLSHRESQVRNPCAPPPLLFALSIWLLQLPLLGASNSWLDVLLSAALSSVCYFFYFGLLELNKFKTQSTAVRDHFPDYIEQFAIVNTTYFH